MQSRTTTSKIVRRGEDVISIPRKEYEIFLRWKKGIPWEIADTNEAIKIAEQEKVIKKIKLARSLTSILK